MEPGEQLRKSQIMQVRAGTEARPYRVAPEGTRGERRPVPEKAVGLIRGYEGVE